MNNAPTRILVVEDYPSMGTMISRILSEAGYSVSVALNGSDAVRLCEESDFDVAVIDIRLPDIDGWDLFSALRRRRSVRAIACTTCAKPEDILRSHTSGFDAHMTKPIQLDDLLRVVAAVAARGPADSLSVASN